MLEYAHAHGHNTKQSKSDMVMGSSGTEARIHVIIWDPVLVHGPAQVR